MNNYINLLLNRNKLFVTIQKIDLIDIESQKDNFNLQHCKYIIPSPNNI